MREQLLIPTPALPPEASPGGHSGGSLQVCESCTLQIHLPAQSRSLCEALVPSRAYSWAFPVIRRYTSSQPSSDPVSLLTEILTHSL